jgi:hypothetical protein
MARAKKAAETTQTARAIKGFDADMKCRGFQFEVGKTYDHNGTVECCSSGFHACDGSPMDVWGYYGPVGEDGRLSRYADVTMAGAISREGRTDSKLASGRITIEAEITLPQFVKRAVDWLITATRGKDESGDSARIGSSGDSARIGSSGDSARIGSSGYYARIGSSGDSARIGSSGDSARIGSSGYYARIGSSGDSARIGSSGDSARIGSSGDSARIGSSGDSARIGSSGDSARIGSSGDSARIGSSGYSARIGSSGYYARIGSSGYYARIGSSGDSARIGSSGDSARIVAEGQNSVVASAGGGTTVSGAVGTWISIAEFKDGKCVGFATGCIGQDGLEAGVPYIARGGKLVPAS